jgi:lipoprotein-anchoring transpeptidase ErfK/SrfK
MPDYYSILWRGLKNGDAGDPAWRQSVFTRSRQALLDELRARRPPPSATDIRLNMDALDAAIATIQSEFTQDRRGRLPDSVRAPERIPPPQRARASERIPPPQRPASSRQPASGRPIQTLPYLSGPGVWIALAVFAAVIVAGVYALVASRSPTPSPPATAAPQTVAPADRTAPPKPNRARPKLAAAADGDLPPGTDGGAGVADVPFFFRRQPVFYRTTNPVGSMVVDKQQHFLYLIQPNQVALRYGIAVGKACADIAGLRKISGKAEWPDWEAPADMVQHRRAPAGVMKGGPGNPLGARLITLDDGATRIHGTNAPQTIGNSVNFGCVRLVNEDIVDLYNRVEPGTRVIFSD